MLFNILFGTPEMDAFWKKLQKKEKNNKLSKSELKLMKRETFMNRIILLTLICTVFSLVHAETSLDSLLSSCNHPEQIVIQKNGFSFEYTSEGRELSKAEVRGILLSTPASRKAYISFRAGKAVGLTIALSGVGMMIGSLVQGNPLSPLFYAGLGVSTCGNLISLGVSGSYRKSLKLYNESLCSRNE